MRRQASAITYFVRTRLDGRQRWLTIGHHGQAAPDGQSWNPTSARRQALRLLADPGAADRIAEPATLTFPAAAQLFLEKHGPTLKPRTRVEYERLVRLYLVPALAASLLGKLTRSHVTTAHLAWSKDAPRSANAALTVLSKLMTWSKDEGLREGDNPCTRVKRNNEAQRRRYLSLAELTRLGSVLDAADMAGQLSPYAIAAVRLLILTGARYTEVLTLE